MMTGSIDAWNQIRVPVRVLRVWRDETGWYCALEDGRVYERIYDKWHPLIGAVEGR
jgi:hypothetical protein